MSASVQCLFCHGPGYTLYSELSDRLFSFPGKWELRRCEACGLVWLYSPPQSADLAKAYATYYTHRQPQPRSGSFRASLKQAVVGATMGKGPSGGTLWRLVGKALVRIPTLQELGALATMCLGSRPPGKLLDVGCGNGNFLAVMQQAGWEVTGVEPDAAAAASASRRLDARIFNGTLEAAALPERSFDAITLNHVIEHVADPIQLLRECRRLLKRGGTIVIATPNIESFGHQAFGSSWVHLDPPRHLYLFSAATLRRLCEQAGLQVNQQRSTFRYAAWTWRVGKAFQKKVPYAGQDPVLGRIGGWLFFRKERAAMRRAPFAGEELLFLAGADGDAHRVLTSRTADHEISRRERESRMEASL